MHSEIFLQDLATVMIVAGIVTVIFHRLKQPVVLGYILAGVIIGPHTPPFPLVHDQHTITTLSELGLILLMFSLGLEFSLRKLGKVGGSALTAAVLEIILMVWIGYEVGRFFAWSVMDSLFLGAMLSISSTTIIIKALSELGKSKERFAELIFGVLIIEDILGIAMIALLSGIAMTGELSVTEVSATLGKLVIFLVVALVLGLILVPRLTAYVSRFKRNEMLLITVLALCFGVSLLAVRLGYSVALGAFLIGAVLAEAREIHRIETLIEPIRDMFSAIFFVSIGLLIDPKILIEHWLPVVVITIAVVLGKVFSCSIGSFMGGNDLRTSLRVGMGLAQIGEFSFIIASLGLSLKVTSEFLYPIAVAVSVLTTLFTPYLIKSSDQFVNLFDRFAPRKFVNTLQVYTSWVGRLGAQSHPDMARRLIRRWVLQMSLNAVLIAAVFIAALFLAQHPPTILNNANPLGLELNSIFWVSAVLISLPMIIATSRKLQALGLLLAETRVSPAMAGERTQAIRAIVSQTVPIVGTVALGLYILALSSTLLPPFGMMVVLLAALGLVAWFLRRSFVRLYSKAQYALQETLQEQPEKRDSQEPLTPILRNAGLARFVLITDSPGIGKQIRELALRTVTGASIVAIERDGMSVINPEPDEELKLGDHLLVLGTETQLNRARTLMNALQSEVPAH